jgi:hypothetical protein
VGLRQDWTLNLTEHALVRTGFEFKSGATRATITHLLRELWSLSNGNLSTITRTVNTTLRPDGDYAAAYFAPRLQPWAPLIVEPGVRFERHTYTGDSGWSPRLNASLALGPRTTVRAAWGIYEQAQGLQELSVPDRETTFSSVRSGPNSGCSAFRMNLNPVSACALEAYERLEFAPASALGKHDGTLQSVSGISL